MKTNKISPVSFQAYIPRRVSETLMSEAVSRGQNLTSQYYAQAKKVNQWGQDTSALTLISKRINNVRKDVLALVNSYHAPMRNAEFTQKGSLLDTFLSLTKKDIVEAEKSIHV